MHGKLVFLEKKGAAGKIKGNCMHEIRKGIGEMVEAHRASISPEGKETLALHARMMNRGLASYMAGDFKKAIEHYSNAIDLNPTPVAHFNRALAKEQAGDAEGALSDLRAAETMAEAAGCCDARINYTIGLVHLRAGDFENAVVEFDKALSHEPERKDAAMIFNEKGNALLFLEKFEEAIDLYGRALALEPELRMAYFNRALAKARKGEIMEALSDMEEYARRRPEDAQGEEFLSRLRRIYN